MVCMDALRTAASGKERLVSEETHLQGFFVSRRPVRELHFTDPCICVFLFFSYHLKF